MIETLCRGMLQDGGRSFCSLLDYMDEGNRESIGNTVHLYKIVHVLIAPLWKTNSEKMSRIIIYRPMMTNSGTKS